MTTRVLLIQAVPTPWDAEGRMGGNPMLPLATDGEVALRRTLQTLTQPVAALFTYTQNQACEQAAKLVARHLNLRVRDDESLEPVSMGLWQGSRARNCASASPRSSSSGKKIR